MSHRLSVSLTLFFAATIARADLSGDTFEMSLEELGQVRVTGAGWQAHTARDAPASVTVFVQDDLKRLGIRYLHDLLGYVPGVYSSALVGSINSHRIAGRGNSGTAPGTLLLYDGQRVNGAQTVNPLIVFQNIPVENMARIEVIRGPGAARFGGGPNDLVINLISRQDLTAVAAYRGNNDSTGLSAQWHWQNDIWQFHFSAQAGDSAGPEYRDIFDRFGRYDSVRAPVEETLLQADVAYRGHQFKWLSQAIDKTGFYALNGGLTPTEQTDTAVQWFRYSKQWRLDEGSLTGSLSELRQGFTITDLRQVQGTGPFTAADFALRGKLEHIVRNVSVTGLWDCHDHALAAGAEWQTGQSPVADLYANYLPRPPFTYFGGFQNTGLRFSADEQEQYTAVYIEDDWRLSDQHHLVAGVRRDDYRQTAGATSPRLAWIYTPNNENSWKLLYQQAFTAPGLGQLYNQNNQVSLGNPNLRPSTIQSLELVYYGQTLQHTFSGTLYQRQADDIISSVAIAGRVNQVQNAGNQQSVGMELTWDWQLSEQLRLKITGSHVFSNEFNLPATLAEQPPADFLSEDTASIILMGNQGTLQWTVGGQWRSREPAQTQANPTLVLLNLRYPFNKEASLSLHVDNLLDEERFDADIAGGLGRDSTGQIVRAVPRAGREFWLKLQYQ